MYDVALVVVLALGLAPSVRVEGADCLDAADIEEALQGLLPDGPAHGTLAVELAPSAEALVVRVRGGDGELLAERRLSPLAADAGSCKQRAQEIAVVVAAAETPDGPAPFPAAVSAPPPTPVVAAVAARAAPPAPPSALQLGVTAGASLAAGAFAPALRVEADVRLSPALRLRLTGLHDGEHREIVGRGQAAWSRWGAAGALVAGQALGPPGLEVAAAAEVAAAWRAISGRGYSETESSWSFDPGAGVDLRLGWRRQRLSLWFQAGAMFWPRAQGVFVRGVGLEGDLARWDLFLGIGGAFGTG